MNTEQPTSNGTRAAALRLLPYLASVLFVLLITAATLPPHVFWSPDEGGRFLQMVGWRFDGGVRYELPYGGRTLDPDLAFYPGRSASQYPRPLPDGRASFSYPPWFPLMTVGPYRVFGIRGLYLIPLLGGLAAALAAGLMAERLHPRSGPFAVLAAGLGTPLLFYSLLFWEHSLVACLCTIALLLLLQWDPRSAVRTSPSLAAAMMCLLAAAAMRIEVTILMAALPAAAVCAATAGSQSARSSQEQRIPHAVPVWLVAGAMVVAAAGACLFMAENPISRFVASHDLNLRDFLIKAGWRLRDPAMWRSLPAHARALLIDDPTGSGPRLPQAVATMGLGGLVACFAAAAIRRSMGLTLWSGGALLLAAASFLALCSPDRFRSVHSLFLPAPCLILAFLPVGETRPTARGRFVSALAVCYFAAYAGATLVAEAHGGAEWGVRYLLPLYVLLTVPAAVRFSTFMGRPRPAAHKAVVAILGALLLLLACQFNVRGVRELQKTKRDLVLFAQEIESRAEPHVTDLWWLPGALAPTFAEHPVYVLNSPDEIPRFVATVGAAAGNFTYLTYGNPKPGAVRAGAQHLVRLTQHHAQGMLILRYAVADGPPAVGIGNE